MPRVVDGTRRRKRRKKILSQTKGFWGSRSKLFRTAKDAVTKSLTYAYRDRKRRKRNFRALWIARISAICRQQGITYSRFMHGLKSARIKINRKALSNLAIEAPESFKILIEEARQAAGAGEK
ncbi:50S ribosomal protein L20 [subsurface metagenome]